MCCCKRYFEVNERFDVNPLSLNDARFGPFLQTLDAEMKRLQGRVYIEYTDFGSKPNAGGLKHPKVDNKCVCQYENVQ